jgi:hypothetical protein
MPRERDPLGSETPCPLSSNGRGPPTLTRTPASMVDERFGVTTRGPHVGSAGSIFLGRPRVRWRTLTAYWTVSGQAVSRVRERPTEVLRIFHSASPGDGRELPAPSFWADGVRVEVVAHEPNDGYSRTSTLEGAGGRSPRSTLSE